MTGDGRLCRGLAWLWLLLAGVASGAQAETRAWLDRDRIGAGETATLNIETDQGSVGPPAYAALERDFVLSGHTSSRQFESVNGRSRTRTLFAVALRPRRDGALQVPPLRVGSEFTRPLALQVAAGAPAPVPARAGQTVFIESELDSTEPYVQQAVGVTLRLYYATSLLSGQFDQDPPEGAALQRVGEDVQYQRELSGKRYTVIERRYLLVPERSGALTLPAARFRGQGMGGFFDDLFGDGRRDLSALGQAKVLQVRPVPDGAAQPWLPVRGVSLQYLATPQAVRAGEAITVTVEARVDGASATQVPELQLPAPAGAQVFADPPQLEESFERGRPQVRMVRRFSVVPAQAGTLRIAGPGLAWWDVRAGAQRTATLPDLQVRVAPGAGAGAVAAPVRDVARTAAPASSQRWIRVPFVQGAVHPWALATVAFALAWLATLWWGLHRRAPGAVAPPLPPGAGGGIARASAGTPAATTLKAALARGDLGVIAGALCASASPPAPDLDQACARLEDPRQVAAVRQLQQARWGGGDGPRALAALREAFAQAPAWRRARQDRRPLLPPLYPRREDAGAPGKR